MLTATEDPFTRIGRDDWAGSRGELASWISEGVGLGEGVVRCDGQKGQVEGNAKGVFKEEEEERNEAKGSRGKEGR